MGFGPLLEDKLCLIFKLAPSVCRMTFPILASLLVRLVVLLPFQLLRLSLATPSRWTPLALSVFLHCVVALDRKSGSAGMPRPISYAVFCLKKKRNRGGQWRIIVAHASSGHRAMQQRGQWWKSVRGR